MALLRLTNRDAATIAIHFPAYYRAFKRVSRKDAKTQRAQSKILEKNFYHEQTRIGDCHLGGFSLRGADGWLKPTYRYFTL